MARLLQWPYFHESRGRASDDASNTVNHVPAHDKFTSTNSSQSGPPVRRTKGLVEASDIVADLFAEAEQYSEVELESISNSVRWKLDLIIMPIVAFTHSLQFMNKTSLNYASAYGLIPDLHLYGQRYAWAAAIFNFGFLGWSFPTNLIIQRVPIGKYTGTIILFWALLQMCTAATSNYGSILAVRFILGMFEAAIAPSAPNIVSMWYTRDEAPFRMCIVLGCNGLAAMISSLLSYGVGHITHAYVHPWQLYFLIVGGINLLWGIVFLTFVPDSPKNAWFLTHEQKVCAAWRVSKNMVGLKNKEFKSEQAIEAILDKKVWCTTIMGAAVGIIIGGVTNFMTALIEGFGFSGIRSTLLQLPLGAIAFLIVPIAGLTATYVRNTRCLVTILLCAPPLAGLIGLRTIHIEHRWALLGCAWLQLLVLGLICLTWILIMANIGGHTKRSVTNGLWFVFFAAGNIGGAHIFLQDEKPRYFTAITVLYICYTVVIVTTATLWTVLYLENHRRWEHLQGEGKTWDQGEREAIEAGIRDVTDKQSRMFRYVY